LLRATDLRSIRAKRQAAISARISPLKTDFLTIDVILQTRNGFLWVGTDAGLARFDGEHFAQIRFRAGISKEIPVQSLITTPEGDLWVGTDAGLAFMPSAALDHFDRSLVKLYRLGIGLSDQIMCLYLSRKGVLYVGTNRGLYRLDRGSFVSVIAEEGISRIEEDSDGRLLIITSRGFVQWDGSKITRDPELADELGVHTNEIYHVSPGSSGRHVVHHRCGPRAPRRQRLDREAYPLRSVAFWADVSNLRGLPRESVGQQALGNVPSYRNWPGASGDGCEREVHVLGSGRRSVGRYHHRRTSTL
jgi:hypothetical protein